jgi:hypothetical protein
LLVLLLTGSVSAGIIQNDSPTPPSAPTGETSTAVQAPSGDGIMQNEAAESLTAEIVADVLLGVLALS